MCSRSRGVQSLFTVGKKRGEGGLGSYAHVACESSESTHMHKLSSNVEILLAVDVCMVFHATTGRIMHAK